MCTDQDLMTRHYAWNKKRLIKDGEPLRVLIVEDEALIALDYASTIEEHSGIVVGFAQTPWQALALAMRHRPDVAIVDIRLRDSGDGIESAHGIVALGTRVVFCSGNGDPASLERVRAFEKARLLLKPVLPLELIDALLG